MPKTRSSFPILQLLLLLISGCFIYLLADMVYVDYQYTSFWRSGICPLANPCYQHYWITELLLYASVVLIVIKMRQHQKTEKKQSLQTIAFYLIPAFLFILQIITRQIIAYNIGY